MLRALTFAICFCATAVAVYYGGVRGAESYERLLVDRVRHGLEINKVDWARLKSDGLRLEIHGRAPSLEAQNLALRTANAVAPISRVVDYSSAVLTPPPVREPLLVQLHRGADELTIMGRFHGSDMRNGFLGLLETYLPQVSVHDLSGETAAPPGPSWGPELELAALAVASLENAFVQIEPGKIKIDGVVADQAARSAFSNEILVLAGSEVALDLTIRVPPVAIAPFEFSVSKTFGGLRVATCAARSAAERDRIVQLLARFGAVDHSGVCIQGLGGPREDWTGAIEAGLEALDRIPAGRLRVSFLQVYLEAAQPTDPEQFDAALTELNASLPGRFRVNARYWDSGPVVAVPRTGYWMDLTLNGDSLTLRGKMSGEQQRDALVIFARAVLPKSELTTDIKLSDRTSPLDWFLSLQTAIEGLSDLEEGSAQVAAGRLSLQGVASDPVTVGQLHRELQNLLPQHIVETAVTVDLPALIDRIPLTEEACLAALNAAVARQPINFEPGEAKIEDISRPVLERIGALYQRCSVARIRVTGFTDSQGREEMNQRLSQIRAEAVMDALIAAGIPYTRLEAVGMGEAFPIATNETPEGRALNRRIEFHAIE
ncbi:MAG: OmpA family protein [Pseudomonadota bacterium]